MGIATVDRAEAVRQALRTLVAEHGFHGASMSAVAAEAGVATGTAYTHYASKDELVLATYLETKDEWHRAAMEAIGQSTEPREMFRQIWLSTYEHLAANRDHALFLLQVDCSPYKQPFHDAAVARDGDPLVEAVGAPAFAALLQPLPLEVLYELCMAPAVRLAASGEKLTKAQLGTIADACWRAVSRD